MISSADRKQAQEVAAQLLGEQPCSVTHAGGGGNNRLYKVTAQDGENYALKHYPSQQDDSRDRLGVEFKSLLFLADQKIPVVPKAFACDRVKNFGLYEWIDGTNPQPITEVDIQAASDFVEALHEARAKPAARLLGACSAACWSAQAVIDQVRQRRRRLNSVENPALQNFLAHHFDRQLETHVTKTVEGYRSAGWNVTEDLPRDALTLSSSDFGFHNALRKPDGRLVFLDFEYFGWDDPVKLVADFLLHPGMSLSDSQKARFRALTEGIFVDDKRFESRLALLYPLYGLCWCLIILNEFIPVVWSRRQMAGNDGDRVSVLRRQLEKAQARLESIHQCP